MVVIVRGWGKGKLGMIASGYRVLLGKYFGIRMVMVAQSCEYTENYWEVHFFLAAWHRIWDSLTRDRAHATCGGSVES